MGNQTNSVEREALVAWARKLPKVELHRHLEGSLRLETLLDIARECAIELPTYEAEALRPRVQFLDDTPDFHEYLDKFRLLRHFYTGQTTIQRPPSASHTG